ncbi:MAG: hypothetical protein IJT25_01030 [Clostridia bacterium]|nr:hypothetical protein [Clostridia bacterium]
MDKKENRRKRVKKIAAASLTAAMILFNSFDKRHPGLMRLAGKKFKCEKNGVLKEIDFTIGTTKEGNCLLSITDLQGKKHSVIGRCDEFSQGIKIIYPSELEVKGKTKKVLKRLNGVYNRGCYMVGGLNDAVDFEEITIGDEIYEIDQPERTK